MGSLFARQIRAAREEWQRAKDAADALRVVERRSGADRRREQVEVDVERRAGERRYAERPAADGG